MRVKAIPLYAHAVAIERAAAVAAVVTRSPALEDALALGGAAREGWVLLCPRSFTATWNGGARPEDVEIVIEGVSADEPAFVQSLHGDGRLTFFSGHQLEVEDGTLWLRGPVDAPRDGLAPRELLIEAAPLPTTAAIDWQFTRPHHTVRFTAGEPFATLLPGSKANRAVELVVVQAADDAAAHQWAFQQMVDTAAVRAAFERMRGPDEPPILRTVTQPGAPAIAPAAWAARLTEAPPVSCICPTYGRVELLEEAIESFLRQDYPGPKELIVLNDYAGQTLELDHPEVKIVNRAERFASVGEKYNAAVALASHDLLFVWHDDDIYLPHRLSLGVAQCEDGAVFWKSDKAWFWNSGHMSGPEKNVFHGGSCWHRKLFDAARGYPQSGVRYDVDFEQRCSGAAVGPIKHASLPLEDLYYIYRWAGTGSYHYSMSADPGPTRQSVVDQVGQQALRGMIPQGRVELRPHWKSDYAAQVREHIATPPVQRLNAQARAKCPTEDVPFPPPYHVIAPPPPLPDEEVATLFRGDHPLRISVILPASNESVLLERTVRQFAATLPPDCEVIVVDNGSTDGSADFLLAEPMENVHLIQTPDMLGVAGARNRGLEAARGEIVVFSDAHIDVPERWWQPLVATLRRPEVGVVGPGIGVMGLPKAPAACGQRIADSKLRLQWLPWKGPSAYPVPTLGGGMMAMRHETLRTAGTFDAGMPQWGSEDLELCVRYWLLGYEVWVAPEVSVLHYFRKSNPYKVEGGVVTHNLLRVALLHFGPARLARVFETLKSNTKFSQAFVHAVDSNVWQKRAEFAARRVRDDDWLFKRFADTCEV